MGTWIDRIREALVRVARIGKLKLEATFLRRERDTLIQQLGSAAADLIERGELPESPQLTELMKLIRALDLRRSEELRELSALQAHVAGAEPFGG